jgi:hypothetical protein
VIPPQADASFVAAMEDVLDVYQRPHDPARPVVCLDETSKQLLKETRAPIAMRKGQPRRVDYEYERNGTASIFMIFAPLEGRRDAIVTERHTAIDYAHALKHVADEMFPRAEKIVLVQDNLNTHKPASLYQAFAPQEARRLTERFEWHLHAEARKLARHGRERAQRSLLAMSRPAYRRFGHPARRGRGLGRRPQQASSQGRLAVHSRRRPRQTQIPLPNLPVQNR